MSVGNAISMLMIPTMLINCYLNVACMTIPKRYPKQFAKRSIKIPVWLFNTCSVLGGFCAAVVAITLFKDLTVKDAIVAAAVIIIPLVFSGIALKTGSVSKEDLHEKRQKIVDAALKAED